MCRLLTSALLAGALVLSTTPLADAGATPPLRVNDDPEPEYNHIFPTLVADPGDSSRLVLVDVKRLEMGRREVAGTCPVHVSADGGASWARTTTLPTPEGFACARSPQPELAYGSGGVLYAAFYGLPEEGVEGEPRIFVSRSRDGGTSFDDPVPVPLAPEEHALGGRPPRDIALGADPDGEQVYVVRASTTTYLWRSTDGGATFGPPTPIDTVPPEVVRGYHGGSYTATLEVGPDGRI